MEASRAQSFDISMIVDDQVAYRNMGLGIVSENFHIIPRHHARKEEQI